MFSDAIPFETNSMQELLSRNPLCARRFRFFFPSQITTFRKQFDYQKVCIKASLCHRTIRQFEYLI